jgi:hypothetical protein
LALSNYFLVACAAGSPTPPHPTHPTPPHPQGFIYGVTPLLYKRLAKQANTLKGIVASAKVRAPAPLPPALPAA